jgi:hypothetical protein
LDKTLLNQSNEKDKIIATLPKTKDFIRKNKKAITAMTSRHHSKEKMDSVKSILTSRPKSLDQKRDELLRKA